MFENVTRLVGTYSMTPDYHQVGDYSLALIFVDVTAISSDAGLHVRVMTLDEFSGKWFRGSTKTIRSTGQHIFASQGFGDKVKVEIEVMATSAAFGASVTYKV